METFDDIIKGDKPVLVDFFATWCGPCKVLSPTVEALGKELAGQVRVLKIDVDFLLLRDCLLLYTQVISDEGTYIIFRANLDLIPVFLVIILLLLRR